MSLLHIAYAYSAIIAMCDPCGYPSLDLRTRADINTASLNMADDTRCGTQLLIDRMRHWSIVGSVGPLHGPGQQRSHASAGQPDRPKGEDQPKSEDQLGPTTSHLGPCGCGRMFRRTRTFQRMNPMCSTNSLRLRRRHHRLPGIHRRRHSDRRAATLRGSGPVSGPVAGRACLGANLCV